MPAASPSLPCAGGLCQRGGQSSRLPGGGHGQAGVGGIKREVAQRHLTVLIKNPGRCWAGEQRWDFRAASSSERSDPAATGGSEAWGGPICSVWRRVSSSAVLHPPVPFPGCRREQDFTVDFGRRFYHAGAGLLDGRACSQILEQPPGSLP